MYMKKIMMLIMFGMFLLSLTSVVNAESKETTLGTYKQDNCVELIQTCTSCNYVNLTSIKYPNSTTAVENVMMVQDGNEFTYEFCNTSQIGTYIVSGYGDVDGEETNFAYDFEITPTGKSSNIQTSIIQILLIVLFVGSGVGFYFINRNINLEKWHNSIVNKYENHNYIKLVLSSIGYNVMKNTFIVYYLIGLLIIVSLQQIVFFYDLTNFISIIKAILIVYSVGIILVGLVFLSNIQEWFMNLLRQLNDDSWGLGE